MPAMVTKIGIFSMQVCVPAEWTDAQVVEFANRENGCGTDNGWYIRRDGDPSLRGDPERRQCSQRDEYVHIMLDA